MFKFCPVLDYQLNYFAVIREAQLFSISILENLLLREQHFIFLKLSFGKAEAFSDSKAVGNEPRPGSQQASWGRLGLLQENRMYWSVLANYYLESKIQEDNSEDKFRQFKIHC